MIQLPPEIIGKAIADPETTLREAGFDPSPDMVDALSKLDQGAVEAFVESFGEAVVPVSPDPLRD